MPANCKYVVVSLSPWDMTQPYVRGIAKSLHTTLDGARKALQKRIAAHAKEYPNDWLCLKVITPATKDVMVGARVGGTCVSEEE